MGAEKVEAVLSKCFRVQENVSDPLLWKKRPNFGPADVIRTQDK